MKTNTSITKKPAEICALYPAAPIPADVICLSHLRWDFVYQRPQHLLSRFARSGSVLFFEEPIFFDGETHLSVTRRDVNIFVCVPFINYGEKINAVQIQRIMLNNKIRENSLENYILWFYTPMAIEFTVDLKPRVTVFDCMDELSAFKFASPKLIEFENLLLEKADLVFTGGQSLYRAKKDRHPNVFAFPSSIDVKHFAKAHKIIDEPEDQAKIPFPKLGFLGVIDERMDTILLAEMADLRPGWHFVMIGPVVKIAPEDLPRRVNIHYLGAKEYSELPAYLSGWDIALMPFAINESTRFISPTKTPEYLAAGKPVISTPIQDVVSPYGNQDLVSIAETATEFIFKAEKILERENVDEWLKRVDEFLSQNSWDDTFKAMNILIGKASHNSNRLKLDDVILKPLVSDIKEDSSKLYPHEIKNWGLPSLRDCSKTMNDAENLPLLIDL
ncbi:MAG: glycosyltransferase family 1 protein [Methylobacter sp.]